MTAIELLNNLQEKIEAEQYAKAELLADDLRSLYVNNPDEEKLYLVAMTIRNDGDFPEGERVDAQQYIEQSASVKFLRSSILTNVGVFLLRPADADGSEVVNRIDTLQTGEQDLNAAGSTVKSIAESSDLPAKILVASINTPDTFFSLGESIHVNISVSNIGNNTAHAVDWEVDTPSGVTASPSSGLVEDISPDSTEEIELGVTGSESGSFDVTVVMGSENAGADTKEFRITVLAKTTGVELAVDEITKLVSMTENLDASYGVKNSLLKKLKQALRLCERALKFIEQTKIEEANEKIAEAKAMMVDYQSQVKDLSGVQILDENAQFLIKQADYIIRLLEAARLADPT